MKLKHLLIIGLLLNTLSCATKADIVYLKDIKDYNGTAFNNKDFTIQPNDILKIDILTPDYKIPNNVYNLTGDTRGFVNLEALKLSGYQVNSDYKIKLHILGEINVKDKTTGELENEIEQLLIDLDQLKNPNVNVRIINTKITIQGEVARPGTYNITEGKITILQALGLAGDLTINGVRNNIMIVRQHNGVTNVGRIDIGSADLTQSPYFYVKQNDYIYVEPNGPRTKSAGYIGNFGTALGIVSATLSTYILLSNIIK